jgi:hypothetical protein
VVVADYVRSYMIPLLLDDLCDGDNCITAAALVRKNFFYLVFSFLVTKNNCAGVV